LTCHRHHEADLNGSNRTDTDELQRCQLIPLSGMGQLVQVLATFCCLVGEKYRPVLDVVHIHAVFNYACVAAAEPAEKIIVLRCAAAWCRSIPWSMHQKAVRKAVFGSSPERMLRDAAAIHYTARAEQQATEASLGLIMEQWCRWAWTLH